MTIDDTATERQREAVADASVGHRQSALDGVDPDGTRQTVLPGPAGETTADTDDDARVVNAFPLDDVVLVRHYFDDGEAFAALRPYYDRRAYRFEIPRAEFRRVRATLAGHGYALEPVEDPGRYAVVVRKYRAHPECVFEEAVAEFSSDEHNVFVLADEAAVEAAVADGATRLADAPVTVRFPTAHGTGPLAVRDVAAPGR